MLVEKEVIAPGTYWYTDQTSGLPRKLDVTSDLTKYWCQQGGEMLSSGLTVPVPCEHDFDAHPMTPKDKLLNNAGWVREYRLRDILKGDPLYDPKRGELKDVLFAATEIVDPEVVKKLPTTIRWTSPWINSFTDGKGKKWNNVISHLALTTRPRIVEQSPFQSVAAALSMATTVTVHGAEPNGKGLDLRALPESGLLLSRAGRLEKVSEGVLTPTYPIAFSLYSGVAMGDFPPKKGKTPPKPGGGKSGGKPPPPGAKGGNDPTTTFDNTNPAGGGDKEGEDGAPGDDTNVDLPPLGDKAGDVSMEEVLCDLLRALGVDCQHDGDEQQFKRNLYSAAMKKVHELTSKGMNKEEQPKPGQVNKGNPASAQQGGNPVVQQEQQPMYMSLEEISKITDPTFKAFAMSVYNDKVKADAKAGEAEKLINSLRDAKLKEEDAKRKQRVAMLSKLSPRVKTDLEAMLALPSMALSMGEGGSIVDPMSDTLAILEKGLGDMPKLLTTDSSLLFAQPQPTDQDMLSAEQEQGIVDSMVRMVGGAPEKRSA